MVSKLLLLKSSLFSPCDLLRQEHIENYLTASLCSCLANNEYTMMLLLLCCNFYRESLEDGILQEPALLIARSLE